MKTFDVVTFGEAMAMFIAEHSGPLHTIEHFTRSLAGAETNVAIGLARLGYKVGYVSQVGADAFGEYIVEVLQKEEVDTSHIVIDSRYPTGFQLKSKVESGDPQVQYFRKGSAASQMNMQNINMNYLYTARHLHMTGIPPALSESAYGISRDVITMMKSAGKTVSLDPNLRPKLWSDPMKMVRVINELAFQADMVLPGISEGEILTGFTQPQDIAKFYLDQGVKLVVVKMGPKGAYYKTETEEKFVAGYAVKQVVDTVGAGDGFAVGIISGYLDGLSLEETVSRANAIGAMAVMSHGDMDGLPVRKQLEIFQREEAY